MTFLTLIDNLKLSLSSQLHFFDFRTNPHRQHGGIGEHGVVVRAFGLYWGGIRFESLSTHQCWSLSKSFIPSLVVWSMTKNNAFGGEKQNKKSNGEQSDLCDLEQVTLKPQLQVHHYLTTWLQIWYHSLLWGDSIGKGADLEKQNCLFGVHPAVMGKLTSLSLSIENSKFIFLYYQPFLSALMEFQVSLN